MTTKAEEVTTVDVETEGSHSSEVGEGNDIINDDKYQLKVTTIGGCPGGHLGLENGASVISFCWKLDRILYWFDSDSVNFAKEDKQPRTMNHNWFSDHSDKRCADYLNRSSRQGANYPGSGYYLIDKVNGVEAILNEEDKVKFVRGELLAEQLEKPCKHVCSEETQL
uniref:DUF295 domain-containing protein n=1 Tax=Steinernema glaseri TaxID=37863 RepID=A0A1I8ASE2_9BILA